MLTLFTTPKPFRGHIGTIQRNAIRSWTFLEPRPEIIIFGNEEGAAEVAQAENVLHVPDIARNEFGTPLLNDLFQKAEMLSTFPVLCYVNADIVFLSDFTTALQRVGESFKTFLMVGQRWDVDIREPLNFSNKDWQASLRDLAKTTNRQKPPEWADYFAFTRGFGKGVLPFAVGRTCWDNWLIWHARAIGASVVDCSAVILAVHQNHDYSHHPKGESGAWRGEEAMRNAKLSGGRKHHYTIRASTHEFTILGIKPVAFSVRSRLTFERIRDVMFDVFVHRTGRVRRQLGLHRNGWLGNSLLGRHSNKES